MDKVIIYIGRTGNYRVIRTHLEQAYAIRVFKDMRDAYNFAKNMGRAYNIPVYSEYFPCA
jgi:hypothetical protein